MVRHEAEENRAYASGFYHTHVYEGTQKLEDLLAALFVDIVLYYKKLNY